jgi:hypothetical protein
VEKMNNHDDAGFILCGQLYSGTMSFASALLNYADKNMRNFYSCAAAGGL